MSMVVGIFQDASALKQVADGLVARGADLERLRVLTCDEVPTELASTDIEFVWIGDVERASAVESPGTGTSVPGIGGGRSGEGHIQGDELLEGLSELGIPDGRTDDYARAVEQGRMIAGYPASADASALRALFSSAGATKIEEF